MKNKLLIGASVMALSLTMSARANAQASNNACGTVFINGSPDVASCVSIPGNYANGIIYNQNDLTTPDGLLIDVYSTGVVQPTANTNAVTVTGRKLPSLFGISGQSSAFRP